MSFEKASAHLDALGVDAMKSMSPAMHRIEALCQALNNPERDVPAIHVAGTNGKTSTARIASSLLAAAGLAVGTYTSPHLQTVRERISLNGEPISKEDFGDSFEHLRPYLEVVERDLGEKLSYFEVLTAMFFLWAAETPVDAIVVEVGLGGRWDATNVLPSSVGVLTNVGLDHTALLGGDRVTIAKEKVGIVKPASPLVTGERSPDILSVVHDEADAQQAEVVALGRDFSLTENTVAVGGRYVSIVTTSGNYEDLYLPLHGHHQGVNSAVALQAVTKFTAEPFSAELVTEGFVKVEVPGRLETIRVEDREATVILDVAHNPDGMSALVTSLIEAFAFDRVVFVVGILADKDHKGMLSEITRVPAYLIATEARSVRSVGADELKRSAEEVGLECVVQPEVAAAVEAGLRAAAPGDLLCITGSHYVVGEARTTLLGPPA